jgi:parvulin-like peptidyl-prolyl isomerase
VTAGVAALERQRLIESYLQETVVPLISYDAEDVRAYYQGHQDDFRGPDEYQIDRIFVEHRERADEVASRLAAGADFVFLARQFDEGDSLEKHATDWVTLASFPPAVGKALAAADIGESAGPFAVQDGWLLLQVRAHRQGAVRPLMEVDKEVRQILFRQQFDKQLDEHLAVLRENSSISLREDRIAAFFGKS